ncbi:MAG: AAA family ATPase [Mycobacterium sp.]
MPDGRDLLTARRRPVAAQGWRKLVTKITAGRVNPEPSAKQEDDAAIVDSIRTSMGGVHKVAFVSAKGGVGKSTMTVVVGNTIARLRGDRVIAVDVDADLGDLSARFSERGGPQANVEQLSSLQNIDRYSNVREHTVVNNDRLELLGAQNDPHSTYRFGPEDYAATMRVLEMHCNVILLDCGTSINGPLFSKIVSGVTGLVVVASQDVRGVEGALATLDWLHAHGFDPLLEHTIVALNAIQKGKPFIDRETVENQFKKRVPEVFRVPYDPHLATGLAVDFSALKRRTREAVLALAAGVAAHYPPSQLPQRRGDDWDTWIDTIRHDEGGHARP